MFSASIEKFCHFISVAFNRVPEKTGNSESVFWRSETDSFDAVLPPTLVVMMVDLIV